MVSKGAGWRVLAAAFLLPIGVGIVAGDGNLLWTLAGYFMLMFVPALIVDAVQKVLDDTASALGYNTNRPPRSEEDGL